MYTELEDAKAGARLEMVLVVLEARDLRLPRRAVQDLAECADRDDLRQWARAAATANSTEELLSKRPGGPCGRSGMNLFERNHQYLQVRERRLGGDIHARIFANNHCEELASVVAKEMAKGILRRLAARQLEVPDHIRSAIEGCQDLYTLDAWTEVAATAPTAEAVVVVSPG
ncbi:MULTISPECIES: hypothetical protein [Actinomadura]|uniref:DUF222 domain-containing protein n=1 Tax=Actinomadura yumaensis TaxID=111807 RepID=A0ABW2CQK4_9ACTN|nr:hypothetical protein [Actinomadura sp. J1-007]MWK36235.1 hypothetical protein [Actinomadura sp. J1-007]